VSLAKLWWLSGLETLLCGRDNNVEIVARQEQGIRYPTTQLASSSITEGRPAFWSGSPASELCSCPTSDERLGVGVKSEGVVSSATASEIVPRGAKKNFGRQVQRIVGIDEGISKRPRRISLIINANGCLGGSQCILKGLNYQRLRQLIPGQLLICPNNLKTIRLQRFADYVLGVPAIKP
jgi:hypothetical protein